MRILVKLGSPRDLVCTLLSNKKINKNKQNKKKQKKKKNTHTQKKQKKKKKHANT